MAVKTNILNFYAKVWKDDTALYFPNGQVRMLTCQHVNEGQYGVNIRGEVFPLPHTANIPNLSPPASPPATSPPTSDWDQQTAMVQAGNVYGPVTSFPTGDPNYKICVKIKDLNTLVTSYVDATDYAANIATCNRV